LQVLKLRGINLRDEDIGTLAPAIGTRVRSLDLRNNQVTDTTARLLLEECFLQERKIARNQPDPPEQSRTPPLLPYLGSEMLATYQGDNFEAYLRNAFTTHFVGRLAFEDAPEGGITHLYISDNRLSVEGISGLIRSGRLHVLDAKVDNPAAASSKLHSPDMPWPGAEKLACMFAGAAADSIRYLRISHEMVTKLLPRSDLVSEKSVVPGFVELSDRPTSVSRPDCAELPDSTAIFELSADMENPCELPGDTPSLVVTTPRQPIQPTAEEEAAFDQARRGSAVAPEAVSGLVERPATLLSPDDRPDLPASSPILTPISNGTLEGTLPSPMFGSAPSTLYSTATTAIAASGRPRTLSNVRSQREARSNYLRTRDGFHPGLVPHLKTLILTDVPPRSQDNSASDRLVDFFRECAEEHSLARKQAANDYTLPPGRRQAANALKDIARGFFALETVVLEMAPEKQQHRSRGSQWRHANGASLTNDRDSEALWKEAGSDFSFFGETEEVRFPSLEPPGRSMFMQAMDGKELCTDSSRVLMPPAKAPASKPDAESVDIIARLSTFRKAKKAEYQHCLARGFQDPEIDGFWPGVVQVVRTAANADPFAQGTEALDYFGNSFSKGYLYK